MEQYESPLDDARHLSVQQVTHMLSLAAAAGQMAVHSIRERRRIAAIAERNLRRKEQALRKAAIRERRERWAPALDKTWLANAGLLQVAEIWGDAMPVADDSPLAHEVVLKCEQRLRRIHPHAMQFYDRFRSEGLHRADAMVRTVPFFARNANVHTGYPAPRRAAVAGAQTNSMQWALQQSGPTAETIRHLLVERRGQRIAERILRDQRLDPAGLRTALALRTNLSPEAIETLIDRNGESAHADGSGNVHPLRRIRSDFPHDAAYALEHPGRYNVKRRKSPRSADPSRRFSGPAGDSFRMPPR